MGFTMTVDDPVPSEFPARPEQAAELDGEDAEVPGDANAMLDVVGIEIPGVSFCLQKL